MRIGRLEINVRFHNSYPLGWKRKVKKIILEAKQNAIKYGEWRVTDNNEVIIYWKIPAIKKCRDIFKWGLKESKDAIEMIEASMPKFIIDSDKNYVNDPRI